MRADLLLGLLALRHVQDVGDEVNGLTRRISKKGRTDERPNWLAAFMKVSLFERNAWNFASHHAANSVFPNFQVVRIGNVIEVFSFQFRPRETKHIQKRLTDILQFSIQCGNAYPHRGMVERGSK